MSECWPDPKAYTLAWKNEPGVSPGDLIPETKGIVSWLRSQGGSPVQPRLMP